MIIIMKTGVKEEQIQRVITRIEAMGLKADVSHGELKTIIGVIGDKNLIKSFPVESLDGVEKAMPITVSYKMASKEFRAEPTVINVGGVKIGGGNSVVMAGPCAVESREQLLEAAAIVKEGGAQFLRGGAFKPRTSPYAFQGLEVQGLKYLAEAAEQTGLKIVTEVTDVASVDAVTEYADMLQIGARNMQNFKLLQAVGRVNKPVLLKRGLSSTINEWLHAAEYILSEGNSQVVLCERGIRTFEEYTRNTLDLSAVGAIKILSHLPIIVDPSHGTGKWRLVKPMALAAVAAGADGVMIEVHPNPAEALSDGPQSLNPENYFALMQAIHGLKSCMGQLTDNVVNA